MSEEIIKKKKRDGMQLCDFISQCNSIHNEKYDYSLVKDLKLAKKIPIICKTHGLFEQMAHEHLDGRNCPKCVDELCQGSGNPTFKKLQREFEKLFISNVNDIVLIPKSLGGKSSTQVMFTCETHGRKQTSLFRLRNNLMCPLCKWEEKFPNAKKTPEKTLYYKSVWHYTEWHWENHQNFINHYGYKRSTFDYHIDHIYSIANGFNNGIPPYIIGHWTNLWLLPQKENSRKRNNCGKHFNQLIADYYWAIDNFNQKFPPIYKPIFNKRDNTIV